MDGATPVAIGLAVERIVWLSKRIIAVSHRQGKVLALWPDLGLDILSSEPVKGVPTNAKRHEC